MSLADLTTRVLTTYKADVDQHVRALEKLKGAERERAQSTIDANKQASGGLADHLQMLGKWGVAIGAATAAAAIAWDGFKAAMERSRLEAAAGTANLDRLKTATLGLKRETDLLRDAARLQTGAFKLSQQQMEIVERAMLALTRQGKDAEKVHESLLQAVTALKTDGLQDLGIFIDKAGLSMDKAGDRAKIFERVMAELAKTSSAVKDGQRSAGEGVEATAVSIQDAFDRMKVALGQLVIAMKPLLDSLAAAIGDISWIVSHIPSIPGAPSALKFLGKAAMLPVTGIYGTVDLASDAIGGIRDAFGSSSSGPTPFQSGMDARAAGLAAQWGASASPMSAYTPSDPWNGASSGGLDYYAVQNLIRRFGPGAARFFAPPGTGEGGYTVGGYDYLNHIRDTSHVPSSAYELGASAGALGDKYGPGGEVAPGGIYDAGFSSTFDRLVEERNKIRTDAGHKSFLEQAFGPIDQFNVYAKGFEMLSGAVTTSMTAWIQGSTSVGMAFKKFIGEALTALASQMAIEALKHGAYALGSLAFGDIRGATTHGAAAAAFGAGAAAAAIAARQMGHGGTDYGKGAGAAAPTGGGSSGAGGGGGDGGRDVIIAYADSFADDSPRARALAARNLVGRVLGTSGVKYQ